MLNAKKLKNNFKNEERMTFKSKIVQTFIIITVYSGSKINETYVLEVDLQVICCFGKQCIVLIKIPALDITQVSILSGSYIHGLVIFVNSLF